MRNLYYDILKAVAIIAVVLYHIGICEFGYLGVDIFLVIAGYFTSKSVDNQIINGGGYFSFVLNRLFRLWPLLLLAGVVCLCFGWIMMLPDDFENTAQSVVATNLFSNNILESITTKNYWDVGNEYKPLMHTWYVGLLMQFYILVPLLLFCVGRFVKAANYRRVVNCCLVASIGIVSLFLYLSTDNECAKFYYLPYRLYEFCAGSLVFYLFGRNSGCPNNCIVPNICLVIIYVGILGLLFIETDIISRPVRLFSTVGLSALLLYLMPRVSWAHGNVFSNKLFAIIGAASFSIFVWHQVVLAFIRYSFTNDMLKITPLISFICVTVFLSFFSYRYVEPIKRTKKAWIFSVFVFVLSTASALFVYVEAGVVRDVPELDVMKGQVHRGMWAEYCDRGYEYDKEFSASDTPKWYVIGNSFGRDMVNIILESKIADKVDVVYSTPKNYQSRYQRFSSADVVFLSTLGLNKEIIEDVRRRCSANTQFFIVGEKNFGESNGQVYRHRFSDDYHKLTIEMEDGYAEKNEQLKKAYPDCYIDLIEMVRQPDGRVRVFSDDGRFISQDCRHLTKAGAEFYASRINWEKFLE